MNLMTCGWFCLHWPLISQEKLQSPWETKRWNASCQGRFLQDDTGWYGCELGTKIDHLKKLMVFGIYLATPLLLVVGFCNMPCTAVPSFIQREFRSSELIATRRILKNSVIAYDHSVYSDGKRYTSNLFFLYFQASCISRKKKRICNSHI